VNKNNISLNPHELMQFLLNRLHENLNRKANQQLTKHDSDYTTLLSEHDQAMQVWQSHQKTNYSIVSDLMHGLNKLTLECPSCSNCSISFEPFSMLSVPVPLKGEVKLCAYFVFRDPLLLPQKFAIMVGTETPLGS